MTDLLLVYITTPDSESAKTIAAALIEERLAACANIVPSIESLFYWNNEFQQSQESLLLLKTPKQHFERLAERAKELHPYELPCIVALPIAAGLPGYLAWAVEETGPK